MASESHKMLETSFFSLFLPYKTHTMKKTLEATRVLLRHVFFCLVIMYFFGFNCRLRPVADTALYKEYITGIIALATIYLNYYLLFPKLYTQRKFTAYWLCTFGSVVMSGLLEMLLVYPQLYDRYVKYLVDPVFIIEQLLMDCLYVTIRNGGLVLLAYTFNEICYLLKQEREKTVLICKRYGFFDVKNMSNKSVLVNIKNIYYCSQKRNIANIHTIDGKRYMRYCSLNMIEEMLRPYEFVRITRDIIVSKPHIVRYTNHQVELRKIPNIKKPVVFQVGDSYVSQLEMLQQPKQVEKPPKRKQENKKATEKKRLYKKKADIYQERTIWEEFEHNPKLLAVYQYIESKNDNHTKDICSVCQLTKSSVNRYIAILMKHNMIQHTGSRRYGGYNVVCQDLSGTGNVTGTTE